MNRHSRRRKKVNKKKEGPKLHQFHSSDYVNSCHLFRSIYWALPQLKLETRTFTFMMLTNTEIWLRIIPVLIIANVKLKGQLDSSKKVRFSWEFQKYPFSFKIAYNQICSIMIHWVDCLPDPFAYIFFLTFVTRIHWLFNTNVTVVMVNQPCSRKIHRKNSPNLSLARFLTICFTNILW